MENEEVIVEVEQVTDTIEQHESVEESVEEVEVA